MKLEKQISNQKKEHQLVCKKNRLSEHKLNETMKTLYAQFQCTFTEKYSKIISEKDAKIKELQGTLQFTIKQKDEAI